LTISEIRLYSFVYKNFVTKLCNEKNLEYFSGSNVENNS